LNVRDIAVALIVGLLIGAGATYALARTRPTHMVATTTTTMLSVITVTSATTVSAGQSQTMATTASD
jgi:hypothetical protein